MARQVLCSTQCHNDGSGAVSLHFAPEGEAFVQGRPGFRSHEAAALRAGPDLEPLESLVDHLAAVARAIAELPDMRDEHERLSIAIASLREEHSTLSASVEVVRANLEALKREIHAAPAG